MRLIRIAAVAAALGAFALIGTASASADSTTCQAGGSIKLSPGLTATPQVQNVTVKGTLAECSGEETEYTNGKFGAHFKTAEAIGCEVLTTEGVGASAEENQFRLKLEPKNGKKPMGTFSLPIAETLTAPLSGTITSEETAFFEDTISGSVAETYTGAKHCGEEVEGMKAKKVKRGTFVGSFSVS